LIDPEALALVVTANSAPVVTALLFGERWAQPIDGGRRLADGHAVLGAHKTWRGLAAGILAACVVGAAIGAGATIGAAFGALALSGDLASSFLKRRLGRSAGQESVLLDPLPESLVPMLALRGPLGLDATAILGTALLFAVLDVAASRMLERIQGRRR
jgi:CDP-2,3-bis-(O-geranylgeranyl)-sn-glycerol synthase